MHFSTSLLARRSEAAMGHICLNDCPSQLSVLPCHCGVRRINTHLDAQGSSTTDMLLGDGVRLTLDPSELALFPRPHTTVCTPMFTKFFLRVSGGLLNGMIVLVQVGDVISANIYRQDDAPLYHRGNTALIIINLLAIALFGLTKVYYVLRNKWKSKKWAAMSSQVRS